MSQSSSALGLITVEGAAFIEDPIVAGSARTFAHGLGVIPKLITSYIECKIASLGYGVGDTVFFGSTAINGGGMGGTDYAILIGANATYVYYRLHVNFIQVIRPDTGAIATITPANWIMKIRSFN